MSVGEKLICSNKKARHDFVINKTFEAGIVLKGSEVKSCRNGRVQLVDSFAMPEKGEIYLHKAHIAEYKQGGPFFNHEPVRKRKLLMHRKEIANLQAEIDKAGYTLVPLKMYFKRGKAKVELGLAKGKTKGDKRQTLKKKDIDKKIRDATRR